MTAGCALCDGAGGPVVWHDDAWRVVAAGDDEHPAFYRVVCQRHVAEFTDLGPDEQRRCMALVAAVEQAMRERLQPTKVNLASLGNSVAHLHWHVIARFDWDARYPQAVWGPVQRAVAPPARERLAERLTGLDAAVAATLETLR